MEFFSVVAYQGKPYSGIEPTSWWAWNTALQFDLPNQRLVFVGPIERLIGTSSGIRRFKSWAYHSLFWVHWSPDGR